MRKWLMPAIVACVLMTSVEQFGLREQAWWLIPCFLFPIAVALMIVRKELTLRAVMMLVMLSGIMALILKLGA
jgi:hypothetical protein